MKTLCSYVYLRISYKIYVEKELFYVHDEISAGSLYHAFRQSRSMIFLRKNPFLSVPIRFQTLTFTKNEDHIPSTSASTLLCVYVCNLYFYKIYVD